MKKLTVNIESLVVNPKFQEAFNVDKIEVRDFFKMLGMDDLPEDLKARLNKFLDDLDARYREAVVIE